MSFDAAAVFLAEFDSRLTEQAAKSGLPVGDWQNTGRRKPETDIEFWRQNGPGLVQRYIDWFEANDDISVWVTPDGIPAIELPLTVAFGQVDVKVVIDQVLKVGSALVVTDLKSGTTIPESRQQLGIYASALEIHYGIRPRYGSWWMPQKEDPFRPVPLDGYEFSVEFLTKEIAMFDKAVRSGIFIANPGKQCYRCGVAAACPALGNRRFA